MTGIDRRTFIRRSALTATGAAVGSGFADLLWPAIALAAGDEDTPAGSGIAWGAHAQPRPYEATQRIALENFETLIERKVAIMRRYAFWDSKVPDETHRWAAENGRTPYISWHAYLRNRKTTIPWSSIARGEHDAFILATGAKVAAFAHPVYFAFHHEPENDPANGTPQDFRDASVKVRHLFDQAGATNVTWIVTLMATTFRGGHGGSDLWLPPADTFDLVGVDGYNRWPLKLNTRWKSFAEIFEASRSKAQALDKGLFVGEYATVEQTVGGHPGDPFAKSRWIAEAADTMEAWTGVEAACYSHAGPTFNGMLMDYWVDTSAESLAAFRDVGHRASFGS